MARDEERYDDQSDFAEPGEGPKKKKSSLCGCCLLGCGAVLIFLIVGAVVIAYQADDWAAGFVDMVAEEIAKDAKIPEGEKQRALAEVKRLTDRMRAGELSWDQIFQVTKAVFEGPVIGMVTWGAFAERYIPDSNLSPSEKAAAMKTVGRFVQGVLDRKISVEEGKAIYELVTVPKAGNPNQREPKQRLTPAELEKVLGLMKDAADRAGVADETPPRPDVADALKEAIDRGLGESSTGGGDDRAAD